MLIVGSLIILGGNFTRVMIHSAPIYEMITSSHTYCSIAGPINQQMAPCGSHNILFSVLLCTTNLVPGGANGITLKLNYPNMFV